MRYLHYVLLGLDPFDDQKMEDIISLHYDTPSAAYYLKVRLKVQILVADDAFSHLDEVLCLV